MKNSGNLDLYVVKPKASNFPEGLDREGVEGIVLVDVNYGGYSISGISFPFVWHDNMCIVANLTYF